MKHYSEATLARLARLPEQLHEHCDIVAHVRSLVITDGKAVVALKLGLNERRLTEILRGRWELSDRAVEALGYRRVVRFERLPIQANRGSPNERID